MSSRAWPSLADHLALAGELFGEHGHQLVAEWLELQVARVGDHDFARSFADHVVIPGVVAGDLQPPPGADSEGASGAPG